MTKVNDVVAGEPIEAAWGNQSIRNRTVQRATSEADRDASWPAPEDGETVWVEDKSELQVWTGTEWTPYSSVKAGDFRVAGVRTVSPEGREVFAYTAEDFERVAGLTLPRRRRFILAEGDDFSLTGLEVEINPELPDSLFELSPPAGTNLRFVGSGPHTSPRDSLCGCE